VPPARSGPYATIPRTQRTKDRFGDQRMAPSLHSAKVQHVHMMCINLRFILRVGQGGLRPCALKRMNSVRLLH
jgi:hypothetical protein